MFIGNDPFDPDEVLSPDQHRTMSLKLLDGAEGELEERRRSQAQEKLWIAVAHQLSAIAEQRGWKHEYQFHDIGRCLQKEYGVPELMSRIVLAEWYYSNFFGVVESTGEIRRAIAQTRELVDELEELRQRPMHPILSRPGMTGTLSTT